MKALFLVPAPHEQNLPSMEDLHYTEGNELKGGYWTVGNTPQTDSTMIVVDTSLAMIEEMKLSSKYMFLEDIADEQPYTNEEVPIVIEENIGNEKPIEELPLETTKPLDIEKKLPELNEAEVSVYAELYLEESKEIEKPNKTIRIAEMHSVSAEELKSCGVKV